MAKAGCRNIYFGVEAGTAEMQDRIDKHLDLGQARSIIGKCTDAGVGVTVGFIAGLPGENAASLRGTLEEAMFFLRLPGSPVHLSAFSPYRGSAHYEVIKNRLVFDPDFTEFPLPPEVRDKHSR